MLIDQFIAYISAEKRFSPLTVEAYRRDMEQFVGYLNKDYDGMALTDVKTTVVKSYIVHLKGEELENRSINRKISTLRTFYKYCLREGLIEKTPMTGIKALKLPKTLVKFVTETDINKVSFGDDADFSTLRDHLLFELLYQTGMRQAEEYAPMLRLLMANWRQAFERPQMPFVIVQLANYMAFVEHPQNTGWSRVREAQRVVATEDPYAELALTIDLGETVDIHPLRKKEVAQRIALDFERLVYGKKVQLAPKVLKAESQDGKVVLTLDQNMQPGAVKYFELADEKGVFCNVEATVSGSQIVITSPFAAPKAVRYAWKDNPLGVNAYGINGLPLSPFEIRLK